MRSGGASRKPGFTLAKVAVVAAALLVGLLIPAVRAVRRQVVEKRIATEVSEIRRALKAYRRKYGRYPPSGADRTRLERHVLNAWPDIDNSELTNVTRVLRDYLDPAEALPFWLGGFSADPHYPFSGPGGPLVAYSGEFYANPERDKGLHDFDKTRLSLEPVRVLQRDPRIVGQRSNDPDGQSDSFPVYVPPGTESPLVYVDSRSYGKVYYPAGPEGGGDVPLRY